MPASTKEAELKDHDARIARLLMKAEVYLSYELYQQARGALDELIGLEPEHTRAHELWLEVVEQDGERAELLEQLIRLAKLEIDDLSIANGYLSRAVEHAPEEEVRRVARTMGLELNDVLRVQEPGYEPPSQPGAWPFVEDELALNSCLFRKLDRPEDLFLVGTDEHDDPGFERVARRLVAVASRTSSFDRVHSVFFLHSKRSFGVYTDQHFASVSEYETASLGRVYGRLRRTNHFER